MKPLFLLSHCLLNNYSKVEPFANRNKELVQVLLQFEAGVIQLPCPEFSYLGGKRWGMVKEQYDSSGFRNHCQNLLKPVLDQLGDYMKVDDYVVYYLGIKGSPSCGVINTCSNESYSGEIEGKCFAETKIVESQGVFIEELLALNNSYGLKINLLEVDEDNIESTIKEVKNILI